MWSHEPYLGPFRPPQKIAIRACDVHGSYIGEKGKCPKCPPPDPEAALRAARVVVGGLDLAKYHDYSAMVVLEIKDGVAYVMGTRQWPHVNYQVVVADVVGVYKKLGMRMLAVDATGLGEPIAEMLLSQGVKTEDIKFGEYVEWTSPWGQRERAPVKYAMMEYARACLQSDPPKVRFPKNGAEALLQQLKEQELVVGSTERVTYAHPEGKHDDLGWAFLMALYSSRRWLTGGGYIVMGGVWPPK